MSNEFKLVRVSSQGVQFGNAWFSHEGITGYTAEQLNEGNCAVTVTGKAYMDWLAAAPQPPALGGEPEVVGRQCFPSEAMQAVPAYHKTPWIDDKVSQQPSEPDFYRVEPLIRLSDHSAHLATLQTEIERQSTVIDRQKNLIQSLRDELTESYAVGSADRLKAWCDELEHRATDVVEGLDGEELPGAMTMRIRKLKAALSKPAGSDPV